MTEPQGIGAVVLGNNGVWVRLYNGFWSGPNNVVCMWDDIGPEIVLSRGIMASDARESLLGEIFDKYDSVLAELTSV